ncbi:MAG: 3-phosphoserine/phosphohydroxythreonine transaminase [Gammaproteobacteria bacterium]
MQAVYNFGPGPAMLPKAVMERARQEFLDWRSSGMSVMEVSHRSKEFASIAEESESDLRDLLAVPDNYRVLFLQGGATSQFAMVPMNFLHASGTADYIHTGIWSGKAIKEAQRHGHIHVAASSEADHFLSAPEPEQWQLSDDPAYVYYTSNETIGGVEFQSIPDVGGAPLVSDMTSNFLSRPLDVSRFGLIIAGSQKNIGPAGLVIVIVRDDLLEGASENLPSLYDYSIMAASGSMFNTPPTFSWYMAGLVFQWIKQEGGVEVMEQRAISRSGRLYQAIDASDFYSNPVRQAFRSRMNIPFTLADESLNGKFLGEAGKNGLVALKGHRSVGGMRASMYNAMPETGCDALIAFMQDFERHYG